MTAASETPRTDAVMAEVDEFGEESTGLVAAHARDMERDRARLIRALGKCAALNSHAASIEAQHLLDELGRP